MRQSLHPGTIVHRYCQSFAIQVLLFSFFFHLFLPPFPPPPSLFLLSLFAFAFSFSLRSRRMLVFPFSALCASFLSCSFFLQCPCNFFFRFLFFSVSYSIGGLQPSNIHFGPSFLLLHPFSSFLLLHPFTSFLVMFLLSFPAPPSLVPS